MKKVLIANRGEIAERIVRTCRAMGIRTVAVFSDADAGSVHVSAADEAVRIGPAPSAESYLSVDALLQAAQKTGADAVHPGYGFLAENAPFAERCAQAGLTFIGPSPEAIRSMGSKREAKALVSRAGVAVIPGVSADEHSDEALIAASKDINLPILVKASAGGGGKGMRVVRDAGHLAAAIAGARREAKSAFGDDTLLIERYIEKPRHVEIQILGDTHGNIVHLFERECSIQRRHQKIIEESPSPALDDGLRARMGDAAVRAAAAIGYANAGTVEFILAPDGEFYFLEVNTRLQVEHPVTELVTGHDLVRLQIQIAEGAKLPFSQLDLHQRGHAIECRLYAEDPANGYLPAIGTIVDWHLPPLEGVRVDAGVNTGTEVGIHYDPMLAKVISHGADRAEAIRRMVYALESLSVQGVVTNRALLLGVLQHEVFIAGDTNTHFLDSHDVGSGALGQEARHFAATAAALAQQAARQSQACLPVLSGYRNNRTADQSVEYSVGEARMQVQYRALGEDRFRVKIGDTVSEVRRASWCPPELTLEMDGVVRRARVVVDGDQVYCHSLAGSVHLSTQPRFPEEEVAVVAGACLAPMPGKIIAVRVSEGVEVRKGQVLVILEAMKMEHSVTAPTDGVVSQILAVEGEQVDADTLLAVVE